ncbi:MAG: cadherin-like beta sandwich domain-containing protein [Acutalibacteraceae bacterium]
MKSTGKKVLASVLAVLISVISLVPMIVSAIDEADGSVTVYLTVSNDGWFLNGDDADKTTIARIPIELDYFPLSDYGLEQYNRYEADSFENGGQYINDTVVEQPTLLHLLIKATEMFKLNGEKYDPSANSDVLSISGSATSMFIQDFWGYGYNLNYYVDHEYPLMAQGWGATADYILLEDNAEVDIALFTNYYFYSDENSGFAYLSPAEITVASGETVNFQTWKTAQDGSNYGETLQNKCSFLTTFVMNSDFQAVSRITDSAANEGAFSYTFENPGTYYVVVLDETISAENPSSGSSESRIAPGVSRVIVEDKEVSKNNKFCLVAESDEKLIIEPEWVYYDKDDTIYDALTSTTHTFDGIKSGFLYSIDGVIFSPIMRTSDNGVYSFDEEASEIANVFRFDTKGIPADNNLVELLTAMADYNGNQEYKDDDNVTAEYNAAKAAYIGIESETAKEYAERLRKAMDELDNADRYNVYFNITQEGSAAKDFKTVVYNEKGSEISPERNGTYNLLPGTYDIEVSKEYNAVYGTITVTDADYTVSAELPSGHHFENDLFFTESAATSTEFLSDTATGKLSSDFSPEQHEYTVYASDETTTVYVNSNERTAWRGLSNADEFFIYYPINNPNYASGTLGYFGNGKQITERLGGALPGMLIKYGEGAEIRLTHEVKNDNGFTQIQSYYINVVRIRSMASLDVHDSNGALVVNGGEDSTVYTASVLSSTDSVTIYPVSGGSYSAGYSISVNGTECEENGGVEVALTETVTTIPVAVSHTDGSSTDYTVVITKTDAYQSVVTLETEGAAVTVTNSAGTSIIPEKIEGNVYTYQLVPGSTYTCTASKNANRSIISFSAADDDDSGENISISVLEDDNWLSDLAFGTKTAASAKGDLELNSEFEAINHNYSLTIPEATKTPYIWATVNSAASFPSSTQTINVVFTQIPSSTAQIGNEKIVTQSVKSAYSYGTKLTNLNGVYGTAEPFEVQVSSVSNGVTYMQVYEVTPIVFPSISSLSVEADGNSLVLDPAFNADTLEYTVSASELTKTFSISSKLTRTINSIKVNGQNAVSGETSTVAMANIENDTIPVTAINNNGVERTYLIKINKLPALNVSIKSEPSDAIIYITDSAGTRVNSEADGNYKMLAGATYDYTVTCKDYIAQTGTYTVPESGEGFTVTLEKAPVNETINKDLEAAWPMFRGDNTNNGTVSSKTPKTADEAVLYWATQDGEGFDSNAIGCPIIVNDYLVYCTGNKLHRMNRFTGEVDELEGTMVAKSSFNIIPPTYADGMIFVALSNGTIQAFNAETFESLWVYYDALGGQPNSPIVYQDGYVYTGFWVGETKDANFVCLSATDENPEETNETKTASWTYTQFGGFYWAGAYACENYILVGTDDGDSGYLKDTSSFLSFDAKTGELVDKIDNLNGDIRSSVSYDDVTDRYYFTTKGGSFYSIAVNADGTFKKDENGVQGYDLKEIALYNYADDSSNPPMSTCTPVVHNGRAYIGVSGTAQFGAYSGHNITVIDLESWSIAYTVRTKGYPQTSGLLTTAYESEDGYAYIYFIDNYTPGQVRVIKDKPGVTEVVGGVKESYMNKGELVTITCAPVLFTPSGAHAQYAICSPISDENGTLYFKNDSAYMMAVGSRVESIEVTQQPDKTLYTVDEAFDKTGMKVTAKLANGLTMDVTDYVTFNESSKNLSVDDTDVTVYYEILLYGDTFDAENGNKTNVEALPPEDYIPVTVLTAEQKSALDSAIAKIDDIGEVILESGDSIRKAREAFDSLDLDLQDLVSNQQTLINAETEYAAIKNVYDKIDAIGEVSYEKKTAISEANEAYNSLTDDQKAKITNASVLESANSSLKAIVDEINTVVNKIDAIGTVTMAKEADIVSAREAYEALPEASKSGVTNLDMLMAAEAILAGYKGDVKTIEDLISAIGAVTYDKKSDIAAARAGYNALSEDLQSSVSNYDILIESEDEIEQIIADITDVEEKIDAIGEVTFSKEGIIIEAKTAYEALPESSKPGVSNIDKLTVAEKAIADFKGKIKAVEGVISEIGDVTVDKESEIKAARTAYDALDEDLKAEVSNYQTLVTAEAELARIFDAVADVESKINAIGTVLLSKEDKIDDAREAYNNLPDEAKNLVSNYETLEKAEKIFSILDFLFGWIVKIFKFIKSVF